MRRIICSALCFILLISSTAFASASDMTRGMAVQMLYDLADTPSANITAPFSDVDSNFKSAINWAYEKNILRGVDDSHCQPYAAITREQFAAMLWRQAGSPFAKGSLLDYSDRNLISNWAEDAMYWCVSSCIIDKSEDKLLRPKAALTSDDALAMANKFYQLPNLTQLREDIEILSSSTRPIGSAGEEEAVSYLTKRFESMGYSVALQEYTSESGESGHNVIAVCGRSDANDILVISAHHDSFPTSPGANDNASGVAALLLAADALKNTDTDTELRFISFTDEENGKNGSRHYVDSLEESERSRIVGCIQLDMLGGFGTTGSKVCTTDGTANWISDLIQEQESSLTLGSETGSDHAIFQLAGIPSVIITQNGQGYLYHSAGDTAGEINMWEVHRAATAVVNAAAHIASYDSTSYQAIAHEQAGNYIYSHMRQSRILFSASRDDNEAYLGFSGELINQWEDKGEFWHDIYEVYRYDMKWFGGDAPMTTHYIYRNNYLENVEIHPAENGYSTQQLAELITSTHGAPCDADETERSWNWEDELYGKYISLKEIDGQPVIYVYSYSMGISNTLASYDVIDGDTVIDDTEHAKVWELLCTALSSKHRQKIGQFRLFTDGFSNILAYTSTMGTPENADNSKFSITIDCYDVYDENGNARDWSKLLFTIIHEYGHVVLENDTQIDLSLGSDIHDPEAFISGSFRQRYYEEFWQDPYSSYLGSYFDKPENYVSAYAGNMFHEDIADTFAVFVFSGKPDGDSIAEQKLLFFWNDSDMLELREDIRSALGLR